MTKSELLEFAKKHYPIGTKFKPAHLFSTDIIMTVESNKFYIANDFITSCTENGDDFDDRHEGYSRIIYDEGKWATIIDNKSKSTIFNKLRLLLNKIKYKFNY